VGHHDRHGNKFYLHLICIFFLPHQKTIFKLKVCMNHVRRIHISYLEELSLLDLSRPHYYPSPILKGGSALESLVLLQQMPKKDPTKVPIVEKVPNFHAPAVHAYEKPQGMHTQGLLPSSLMLRGPGGW
jgi:hypothetical protein